MIVAESDLLVANLDRRLQVDATLALDPLAPIAGAGGEARVPLSQPGPSVAAPRNPIAERLPLGQNVAARVVDVPSPGNVLAEVAGLIVSLSWPGGSAPAAGSVVTLRVLSHSPLLLFESPGIEPSGPDETDTPTHLSANALSLQSAGAGGNAPVRFQTPILRIEIEPVAKDGAHDGDRDGEPSAQSDASRALQAQDRIALDDVIVARSARIADEGTATAASNPVETRDLAQLGVPLVLQGPAWHGQDVELVVRRERADESFDNPVLDQWRGDLVIDLPRLGRVAGHLAWSMQGLRIRLEGQDDRSVASMNASTAELAAALTSVDLPVLSVSVSQPLADMDAPRVG